MLKKILACSLLSLLTITSVNLGFQADAKNNKNPPGLAKKAYNLPPGQAKKLPKNNRVIVTTQRVYVTPRITVYKFPLMTFNQGTYYFYSKSPAYISSNKAKYKGYKTNVYFYNNRWVLQVR